jgi:hypothetical protein
MLPMLLHRAVGFPPFNPKPVEFDDVRLVEDQSEQRARTPNDRAADEAREHAQREREIEHDRMLKSARIKDKL